MKKYIITVIIAVLGVVMPFAVLRAGIESDVLAQLIDLDIILYLYPIYLPILCGCIGVKIFKDTGKILLPTLLFNVFLFVSTIFLTGMILGATSRSLADAAIALLLFGPTVYSAPISPIAAAICKHKMKKAEGLKNNEDDTTNETQI